MAMLKEFLEAAFSCADLNYQDYLIIDKELYRPSEVIVLQGDASKARKTLNWSPNISFEELVKEMVESDLEWYSKNRGVLIG